MFDLASWLSGQALPFWAEGGFDTRAGLFHEQVDIDTRPIANVPRRLVVQARQIYVFAAAELSGMFPGGELAERVGEIVLRAYSDNGGRDGFAFSVAADGRVIQDERDLYTQAFALFALAWLARLTGRRAYLDLADAALAFLDARMAVPTGGYREQADEPAEVRRQNPHMHLVEALLALHEVDPSRGYIQRIQPLIELIQHRFLRGDILLETCEDAQRTEREGSFCFEPGHHFEWSWLLARYAYVAGEPLLPIAVKLYARARRSVTRQGLVVDLVDETGRVSRGSTRLWPHAEAARTATLLATQDGATLRASMLETIWQRFLQPAAKGCWIDRFDATGASLSHFIPASTLYHLMGAACSMLMQPEAGDGMQLCR